MVCLNNVFLIVEKQHTVYLYSQGFYYARYPNPSNFHNQLSSIRLWYAFFTCLGQEILWPECHCIPERAHLDKSRFGIDPLTQAANNHRNILS